MHCAAFEGNGQDPNLNGRIGKNYDTLRFCIVQFGPRIGNQKFLNMKELYPFDLGVP
jgi:hypothetical protein